MPDQHKVRREKLAEPVLLSFENEPVLLYPLNPQKDKPLRTIVDYTG